MDGGVPKMQEHFSADRPGLSPPETGAFFYSKPNASSTLPGEPTIPPLPAVT